MSGGVSSGVIGVFAELETFFCSGCFSDDIGITYAAEKKKQAYIDEIMDVLPLFENSISLSNKENRLHMRQFASKCCIYRVGCTSIELFKRITVVLIYAY